MPYAGSNMLEYLKLPELSYRWIHVWRRNLRVWWKFLRSWFVGIVGEPVLYLLAIGFGIGQMIEQPVAGVPYFVFIVPGLLAATAMNAATFEVTFGSYTRMSQQRTFHSIVTTPVNMNEVAAGDIAYAATKSLLNGTVFLLIVLPMTYWQFDMLPPLWALPIMLLVVAVEGLLFASMGLLVTAFARGYEFFSYYLTLVVSVMFLFAGVFFPIGNLPAGVQWIAWIMPLAYPTRLLRELFLGSLTLGGLLSAVLLAALTCLFFVVAVNAIRIRLIQ
jgi:lipooligosaccharide transport system permease protein